MEAFYGVDDDVGASSTAAIDRREDAPRAAVASAVLDNTALIFCVGSVSRACVGRCGCG